MQNLILVMVGGAAGAALRYGVTRSLPVIAGWSWPTLFVNVSGGLLMGMLAALLTRHGSAEPWRMLLSVGVLGGFTTFSAFSMDTMLLIESGRWTLAFGYALASVTGSVAALAVGLAVVRAL